MPDDGYSEVGGGGSIRWALDVKRGEYESNSHAGTVIKHKGIDRRGIPDPAGSVFEIVIKEPAAGLTWKTVGNKVIIYVPIDPQEPADANPKQIRVKWVQDKPSLAGLMDLRTGRPVQVGDPRADEQGSATVGT